MDKPPLLLIGGAVLPTGVDCVEQAAERGVPVVLVDTARNLKAAPELVDRCREVVALSYSEPTAVLGWVRRASWRRFLGVYGTRETAVESVAAVAEELGLPGNSPAAVRRVQDKAACRAALAAAGFTQPPSARCTTRQQVYDFMAAHRPGPWIVKPPRGRGSAGVSLIEDGGDLDAALCHLADGEHALTMDLRYQGLRPGSRDRTAIDLLIEGYQTGTEHSAEGIFVDGRPNLLTLTDKLTTGAPNFVELGHTMPAELADARRSAVVDTLEAALPALGLRWGLFHVEFWLPADGRVVLGEVHARPGGDYIQTMAQHVSGVQMHGTVIDQMLGRSVDPRAWRPVRGAAVRFMAPRPGVVTNVEGWPQVTSDRSFLGGIPTVPGAVVRPLKSSYDRASFVCASGPDASAAAANADRLRDAVTIETDPGEP
jgi:biotin carboxylase